MRRLLVGVAAVVILVASAAPAMAQSAAIQEARRHMEDGQEFFLQERWTDAATEFLAAFDLRAHGAFLFNAALALHRAGDAVRAVDLYERYLELVPDARDRGQVEDSLRLLRRAIEAGVPAPTPGECTGEDCPEEGETCAEDDVECQMNQQDTPPAPDIVITLDPEAAAAARRSNLKAVISVEVVPNDAMVTLFGDSNNELMRVQGPLEYSADEGQYVLFFEHPEYRDIRIPFQADAGRVYNFRVEMSNPPSFVRVVANEPGSLVYIDDRSVGQVGTTPYSNIILPGTHRIWVERPGYQTYQEDIEISLGQQREITVDLERLTFGMARVLTNIDESNVLIDGEPVGQAPVSQQLDPGEHELRVTSRGMKDYETRFTIERGQTTRVLVRMNPRPSRTSAWVSLAFSALTFAAAGVVGYLSTNIYDDLEQDAIRGRLATDDARINRGFIMAMGADVGFGIGTIIAGLTLYYFLRDPLPESDGRVEAPVDFTENPLQPGEERAPIAAPAAARPERTPTAAEPEAPREAAPAETAPAETPPAETAPAETAPAEAAPGGEAETAPEPAAPDVRIVPVEPAPEATEGGGPEASRQRRLRRRAPRGRAALAVPRVQLGLGPGFVLRF